ncbi:hypothetical protein HRH59_14600 [Rheinheimera sp. YQF-2]|uniref:Uncharacterized protein n=1 Tax=Rheinheimera lutimaris TaxID=2740584 RepID=A0A7Y5ASM0_9GAMM|nr:hypothetical protein [Rheinheimera lutimaris]NRQ43781.1 hypothetical protein [Rheinheimera lutimaris]
MMNNALLVSALLLLSSGLCAQQREQTVQLESTISGNQEQPKTIYVLPWQSPVSLIRIPGQPLQPPAATVSPLDRSQFLRFIAVQQSNTTLPTTQSVNSKEQ